MNVTRVGNNIFSIKEDKEDTTQTEWDNPEAEIEVMVDREKLVLPLHGRNNRNRRVLQEGVTQTPGKSAKISYTAILAATMSTTTDGNATQPIGIEHKS